MTPISFRSENEVIDSTGRTRWEYNSVPAIGRLFLSFNLEGLSFNAPGTEPEETEESEPVLSEDDYENEEEEEEVKPYRGKLTYTNGEVNKQGQPFPDIMDFRR